jgi:translocation and assembly module TamB
MRKWLKRIGIALAVLVMLALSFSLWLQHTESGARFAIARALSAAGGKLTVTAVRGTLAGPLFLSGVRYADPKSGVDAKIGEVKIQFALSELFGSVLHFNDVTIDNVDVALTTIAPPPNPPPPTPLQQLLTPPLAITLDRLKLGRTQLSLDKTPLFALDSLELAATWTHAGITIRQFALRSREGRVDLNGALTSYTDYRGKAKADIDWNVAPYRVAGSLNFTNDGRQSQFALVLTQPFAATLNGTLVPSAAALPWTLTLDVPAFDPAPLTHDESLKTLAVSLHGSGDRNGGTLTGNVDANAHRVLLDPLRFALAEKLLTIETLHLRSPEAVGTLNASGRIRLDGTPVGGDLTIAWDGVELPADLVGQVLATQGSIDASGNAQRFGAKGDLSIGPRGKPARIGIELDGTPQAIALRRLELKQPNGGLTASGEVALKPQLGWKLDAKANRLDPGAFAAQWPGALSFDLSTNGTLEKDGAHGKLKLDRLSGTLRQRSVSGSGDIAFAPPLSIDGRLDVASGDSRVAVRGKGGHETDATVEFDVASLGDWLPLAAGSLRGKVALRGAWPKLAIDGDLHGAKLAYQGSHVAALDLAARTTGVSAAPGGTVSLHATGVSSGDYTFDNVTVDASGSQDRHAVKLDARGAALALSVAVDGALTQKPNAAPDWRGSVSGLTLQIKDQAPWKQDAPTALTYSDGIVTLGELCLRGGAPGLCVSGANRADGSLQAKYTLQHLPLSLVARLAAPDAPLRVQGEIDGSGDIARSASGALSGRATLNSASGSVAYPDEATQPLLAYKAFALDAVLAPEHGSINLNADLDDGGKLQGNVGLGANGADGMPLSGALTLHLNNLRFVDLLTTSLVATQGKVDGTFTLAGTTQHPGASGEVALRGFATEVPAAGIKLSGGEIRVHSSDGKAFAVDGTIASGDGKLAVTGTFGLGASAPLAIKIDGENFLAADIPGAQVRISPALTLHRDDKRFAISGEVSIPRANIDIAKLPGGGASQVSSDVVIKDEPVVAETRSLPLDAEVTVKLGAGDKLAMDLRQGREVHLVGFGLDGNLSGQLTVQDHPGRATTGRGQIEVNGTYKAYGQDLKIEQGRLLFAGTPVENPGLDLRAVRAFPDQSISVGVQVRGTAERPELSVFSNPAMEQSDALSYLVTGKPMSQLRGGEGDAVGAAARALGTAGGDLLAKSIGAKMGVDDVGIADNSSVGGAALTVGKYLSPRLYLSYGGGLFTPGEVVTLRYKLTRHFDAEMRNGTLSSRAGINYKIEK